AALDAIGREVTYIGSSRAPVLVRAYLTESVPSPGALVPDDQGHYRIRGIHPGRLDDLEEAFQQGRRPRPAQTVGYSRLGEERLRSLWGQMIPLQRLSGQPLHIDQSVRITEAVRRALTAHLPNAAPGMLTGHAQDGRRLLGEHLAIVPLPRIGDRYADGEILGVGLLLPVACSDAEYEQLLQGLQSWLAAGARVDIGDVTWRMKVTHGDERLALRPDRYAGFGETWVTATPVICDRHPRRTLTLRDVVSDMCRDVGLPPPEAVVAAPYGSLKGSADSRSHSLGQRAYLAKRYTTHLTVTWSRKVPGPILLGRGRYFGMGAMLPSREAA
ncbi:MAG: type I-U CRISPR-associated protein Cas5/Cas6, partial [Gammaproteobacteria bacterium]|nr:type I-U CRISPR-associated protein Cas5/Cas6 [Gammaproteobacteria bacterium]